MRIVAGALGGRKLNVPKGRDIRPTSDKVRGAIFNTLLGLIDLKSAMVLDAFCGTGALGLEAISRGAVHCCFVDKARTSLDLARENASVLDVIEETSFLLGDASKVHLNASDPFDLVFLDPPYRQGLIVQTLLHLDALGVLQDGAVLVLESETRVILDLSARFDVLKDKVYGDTLVTYVRYKKSVP